MTMLVWFCILVPIAYMVPRWVAVVAAIAVQLVWWSLSQRIEK
jgi:hypothetical protein